jgi:glycosyltransferase involved in cell wall biosynthesis
MSTPDTANSAFSNYQGPIHIIAPFALANGGDWHAIDLHLQYSKTHQVMLWSQTPPNTVLKSKYSINEIKPYSGQSPHGGILIICGARTDIGHWYEHATFEKVIIFHNLLPPRVLYKALNRLTMNGNKKVEVWYASELNKQFTGLPGKVMHHFPPVERFKPIIKTNYGEKHTFTVGRVSTDMLAKHHHSDPMVYRRLSELGINIRIVGGTCLKPWIKIDRKTPTEHSCIPVLTNSGDIELLPVVPQNEVANIYHQLDCFYYRVPSIIKEPYGLVVIEAMLSGLPVVCHRDGGYTEVIKHGINGFIFDNAEEAIEIIKSLKNNADLREKIGRNARNIYL